MAHSTWSIGEISYAGDCRDSAGHQILNAGSYRVQLISSAERLNVEVAVTKVASSYALNRLHHGSFADATNAQTVDRELVRCFVEEELNDEEWDPRKTPWLTIDSQDVPGIVDRLLGAATLR